MGIQDDCHMALHIQRRHVTHSHGLVDLMDSLWTRLFLCPGVERCVANVSGGGGRAGAWEGGLLSGLKVCFFSSRLPLWVQLVMDWRVQLGMMCESGGSGSGEGRWAMPGPSSGHDRLPSY